MPVHCYSPVPHVAVLTGTPNHTAYKVTGVDPRIDAGLELVQKFGHLYGGELARLSQARSGERQGFDISNSVYGLGDADIYYFSCDISGRHG